MASGRINSPESVRTAAKVVRAFGGSWAAVERAARPGPEGVRVISRSDLDRARRDTADRG